MATMNRRARRAAAHGSYDGEGGSLRDVLGPLIDRGALTPRQIAAGNEIYNLLTHVAGSSGGLIMGYKVRIDNGSRMSGLPRGATGSGDFLQRVFDGLMPHERRLLQWLVTYGERPSGRRALSYYVHDVLGLADVQRTSATQMAIGHIQALLEAVALLLDTHRPAVRRDPARGEIARRVAALIPDSVAPS